MRFLFLLSAFFSLLPSICSAQTHEDIVQDALSSTVVVRASYITDLGRMVFDDSICSGVIVGSAGTESIIATARHCTDGFNLTSVRFRDGDMGRIDSIRISKKNDVAVLTVRSGRPHRAAQTSTHVSIGEFLFVVGMPSGDPNSYDDASSRNGSELSDGGSEGRVLLINCSGCWHGDSGAGVFNQRGQVVGILDAGGDDNFPTVVLIAPIQSALNLIP